MIDILTCFLNQKLIVEFLENLTENPILRIKRNCFILLKHTHCIIIFTFCLLKPTVWFANEKTELIHSNWKQVVPEQ